MLTRYLILGIIVFKNLFFEINTEKSIEVFFYGFFYTKARLCFKIIRGVGKGTDKTRCLLKLGWTHQVVASSLSFIYISNHP